MSSFLLAIKNELASVNGTSETGQLLQGGHKAIIYFPNHRLLRSKGKHPQTPLIICVCSWSGRHFWGVSCGGVNASSESRPKDVPDRGPSVVLSSSEKQVVKEALSSFYGPDKLMYASGAGYKILCVIQGLADIYVLSERSTFKWDSCAPHALLRALGGGVADLAESLRDGQTELTYHQPREECKGAERWANHGGLVAYRDPAQLHSVVRTLKGKL